MSITFLDRDLSWLSFNGRVLGQAAREDVPLLERINFLSIYSSNLDEFYRVRIPALAALEKINKKVSRPASTLDEITRRITVQLHRYGQILHDLVLPALAAQDIHFIYDQPLPEAAKRTANEYFFTHILAFLEVVHLKEKDLGFFPDNDKIYLAVVTGGRQERIHILNIPSDGLPRFFLADTGEARYILFIDDIVREHLGFIFPGLDIRGAYSIKVTRDAELDLEDEYAGDIAEKIEKKLAKRDAGLATRLLYQPGIPTAMLQSLIDALGLHDASVMEGGRYHNLRDLSSFPLKDGRLSYPVWPAKKPDHVDIPGIMRRMEENDILLHTPYESYDPVLQFFNEAAIDPAVEEIYLTMYRVARDSRIMHALISASHNGKKVTVFVELKARFDEANNLRWARQMRQAGIRIIYSIPGLKVHAKVALVKKRVQQRMVYYGLLATGNLNENTARFYTDHILLTCDHDLMREIELLFIFLERRRPPKTADEIAFKHLLIAQFNLQTRIISMIDREIANARQGLPSGITIKMNNLEEKGMISKLYEASNAGVPVTLIIRSICCCIPGIPGMSANITLKRIVDRYLEHGRIYLFHNDGKEALYLGSADWMNRNIFHRIEVCFPINNPGLKEDIKNILRLQAADNIAATSLDADAENVPLPAAGERVRSQEAVYHYITGRSF